MDRLVLQEVALLAIRKAGAILATLRRARGGAGGTKPASVAGLSEYAKALKDAKVPETTARYWQRVANASEGKLQAHLEWAKKDDREVTTAGLIGYQQHQSAEDIAACAAIPLTKAEQEAKARLGRLANRLFAVAHVVCAQSRILFDGTPQNELEIILSFEQLEKVVEVLEALGNDQRKRLLENAKGPPHIVCVFGPYDSRKRRKVSPGGLARPERRFVNAVKIKTEGGNKMFTFDVTGTIKAVVDETENSDEVREKIKRAVEGALRNATANICYNDKNVTVEVMVAEQRHVALRA